MPEKPVHLGGRLHYPIKITKLCKSVGEKVKKQDVLFEYKFSWRRQIDDDEWTDETTYTEYNSPAEGVVKQWRVQDGEDVHADKVALVVDEPCGHEVQMHGMCSLCGADMTETNWASESRDADRAKINMTHDHTGLLVSQDIAEKAEYDTQKSLLRQQKLSLVVDLDQTIIHACVDPTVEKWMGDPSSPNHKVVQDVRKFYLTDGGGGQWYYIKLRPGLEEFLEAVAEQYEMHVYTMGTRAYAEAVVKIVDPHRRYFGSRIISRTENGPDPALMGRLAHQTKQLRRLFPVSTNMVVIIDDRSDVWRNDERHLIKVVPFDFFKGQGDLNSPFAPQPAVSLQAPAIPAAPLPTPEKTPDAEDKDSEGKVAKDKDTDKDEAATPEEKTPPANGGAGEATLAEQEQEHEKAVEKQLVERPLLHMQEELEKEEGQPQEHRPQLLIDDDEELIALQDHLTDIHKAFYATYHERRAEIIASDVPQHLPGHTKLRRKSTSEDQIDLSLVPNVGDIMTELRSSVMEGLVLVLSGLIPMGKPVEESELGKQVQSFGGQVLDQVSRRVTHLVVARARPRTKKVQQAAKIPSIKIVNEGWLMDCISQWRRLEEGPYYLNVLDADRGAGENVEDEEGTEGTDADELGSTIEGDGFADIDWADADKELAEIMDGTSDEDTDTEGGSLYQDDSEQESSGSDGEPLVHRGTKRKSGEGQQRQAGDGDDAGEGSVLAKKQKLARERGRSGLRAVTNGDGEGDDDDDMDEEEGEKEFNPDTGEDFDEDEMEAALMAELDGV